MNSSDADDRFALTTALIVDRSVLLMPRQPLCHRQRGRVQHLGRTPGQPNESFTPAITLTPGNGAMSLTKELWRRASSSSRLRP